MTTSEATRIKFTSTHEVDESFLPRNLNLPTAIAIAICLGSLTLYYEIKDWGTQLSWKLKNRSSAKSS